MSPGLTCFRLSLCSLRMCPLNAPHYVAASGPYTCCSKPGLPWFIFSASKAVHSICLCKDRLFPYSRLHGFDLQDLACGRKLPELLVCTMRPAHGRTSLFAALWIFHTSQSCLASLEAARPPTSPALSGSAEDASSMSGNCCRTDPGCPRGHRFAGVVYRVTLFSRGRTFGRWGRVGGLG